MVKTFKTRAELDNYLSTNIVYTGEYLETMSAKDFATADPATREAVKKMAKLGRSEMSMQKSLEKLEAQAKSIGYDVVYEVNPNTNTVEVVLLRDVDLSKTTEEDFKKIKAKMPTFKISVGTAKRGTKSGITAPKSYAPHIGSVGTVLVTQVEESIDAVSNTLKELKSKKKYAREPEYVRSKVKTAQRESEKSIVTTEGYSIVDEEKWFEELQKETSNARDSFVRTSLRIAGITGEVVKKGGFLDKIKNTQKLTKKQTEEYNKMVDKLLTEYVAIYTQLGEQTADKYFADSKVLKQLGIETENEIKQKIAQTKALFGDFLAMRSTSGLSSDEMLGVKKISFAGDRDLAFRGNVKTGRHSSQVRNYLEKSQRAKERSAARKNEIFIPMIDKDDLGYYASSGHQLYSRGLALDEPSVHDAYNRAVEEGIEEAIEKRIKNLRKSKKYKKASDIEKRKMEDEASEKIRNSLMKTLPLTAPSVMEDMGIMSESAAKEFESVRTATATITGKEYDRLEKLAIENYAKFSDKTKGKISEEEYRRKYIAKKTLGRKRLEGDSIDISFDDDGNYYIEAQENVGGGTAKLLSRYTGLRETDKAIPDWVFKRMSEKLGLAGADVISLAKTIKAEEIPGAIQAFLSQAVLAGKATAEQVVKDLRSLGFEAEADAQGHVFINNADDAVKDINWNDALSYLDKLGILKQTETGDFEFRKGTMLSDVINRADTWDVGKGVKVGYKERAGVKRDIAIASAQSAINYTDLSKDIDRIFDPTMGGRGDIAAKARRDREAILDTAKGSIAKTYTSVKSDERTNDFDKLKKSSFKGRTNKNKKKYIISIGNGPDYTIDVNQLLNEAVDYTEGGGSLTPKEYEKTVLGAIDAVKNKIRAKVNDAEIDVVIDPGTDFGFGMSFGEGGVEEGAVGRFIYLPNVETDVRFNEQGEKLYDLPEYATALHSLIGNMKVSGVNVSQKAQELTQGIFSTAHSTKGSLYERAFTKRPGSAHGGHITAMSRVDIDKLIEQREAAKSAGDEALAQKINERVRRLMSAVWVSPEVAKNLLSNKDQFTSADGIYDIGAHGQAIFSALKYLSGEDFEKIYGARAANFGVLDEAAKSKEIKDLIPQIVSLITEQPGEAGSKRGLIGMLNRFPSISKHPEVFGEMLVSGGLKGFDMEIGPALAKFLNGDYDGDTAYLILGLWSSGMSFEAAAEMVERQKSINEHVYKTMLSKTAGDTVAVEASEAARAGDPARLGLSALATKFNKPYTGMFSNMSTRIREGLRATGYDYIDEQSRPNFDLSGNNLGDYVSAIQGELVAAVGQILEQDSISAKKVDKRIEKMRQTIGHELSSEEIDKIEQDVLHEFEKLDAMLRDPKSSYEQIIEYMKSMGLFADEATQITATLTGQIKYLVSKLKPEQQEAIYKKLGLSIEDIEKGVVSPEAFKMAGSSIERELSAREGKDVRIFAGEYGSGFATSRKYTEGMKNDTYELLRYIKELNGALRQTGEIIDENGNKFNKYGEKVAGTRASLKSEAEQESAKVIIAGKEGKAIERNADSYSKLSEKLEEAKGDYKAVNRLSVSELKDRLLPYAGERTTGLDQKALNEIYAGVRKGETFSKKDLVERFGVRDEKALNSLFLSSLSTIRGNYIHSKAQGDKEGTKKAMDEILKLFKVFGLSFEEKKETFKNYVGAAKNVKEIAGSFGRSLGSEVPLVGMTSNGQYVVNARTDEIFVRQRQNRFDKTKEDNVVTIVDYKSHEGGKLQDSDIAQGIIYKAFMEELRDYIKGFGDAVTNEELAEKIRQDTKRASKYTSDTKEQEEMLSRVSPELIGELRKGNTVIETAIIVTDPKTREAQGYSIGSDQDKYRQFRDRILSGDTSALTTEEKTVLRSNAKRMTDAAHYRRGIDTTEAGGIENKIRQESKETDAEKEDRLKEYLKLLDQQYEIQLRINKLKHEENYLAKQGADLTDVKGKLADERSLKRRVDRAMKDMEKKGFDEAAQKKISQKGSVKDAELKYKSGRFGSTATGRGQTMTTEDQIRAEGDYEKTLNKTLSTYKKIIAAKHQADTTTGQEKQAAENLVVVLQKQLGIDKQHIQNLKQSGLLRENQVAEIEKQFALDMATAEAQEKTKRGGASNLFDVIKNDVRRATMRITDFGLAAKALNSIPQSIQKAKQLTGQLEEALMNLRVVAELNREEGEALILTYAKMGKELGATTTEVAASGNEWLRQGYNLQEANKLIASSTKLAKLGMISQSEATKALNF